MGCHGGGGCLFVFLVRSLTTSGQLGSGRWPCFFVVRIASDYIIEERMRFQPPLLAVRSLVSSWWARFSSPRTPAKKGQNNGHGGPFGTLLPQIVYRVLLRGDLGSWGREQFSLFFPSFHWLSFEVELVLLRWTPSVLALGFVLVSGVCPCLRCFAAQAVLFLRLPLSPHFNRK